MNDLPDEVDDYVALSNLAKIRITKRIISDLDLEDSQELDTNPCD